MAKYISCADTAKLVRQALKEAFSGVKFSVRSSTYSGGASISVGWTDGPSTAQVDSVACGFNGSYFDGSIDYKGSISHMMNGEAVRFCADSIFCSRAFSDAAIQRALNRVVRRYAGAFSDAGLKVPTLEQYRKGNLWGTHWPILGGFDGDSFHDEVNRVLFKNSDRLRIGKSKTAAAVFVTHDDGYSRSCGEGFSAVPVEQ